MTDKTYLNDLVDQLAAETGITKQLAHQLINEFSATVREGINSDGQASVQGLGRFVAKWQKARPGRHPQSGEVFEIPAHNVVSFKPATQLRDLVNQRYAHLEPKLLEEGNKPALEIKKERPVPVSEIEEKEVEQVHKVEIPATDAKKEKLLEIKPDKKKQGKRSLWWIWFLLPVAVLALIWLLWPFVMADTVSPEKAGVVQEKHDRTVKEDPKTVPASTTIADADKTLDDIDPVVQKTAEQAKPKIEAPSNPSYPGGTYTVQDGERLRVVATKFYDDPLLWPLIYSANRKKFRDPDILPRGIELKIPPLEGRSGSLSNRDKEIIAEAFIHTHLRYKKYKPEKAMYYLWVADRWNIPGLIEKFKDQISSKDLERVRTIDGEPGFGG